MPAPPAPPDERDWTFVDDLRSPEPPSFFWTRETPRPDEAVLSAGVRVEATAVPHGGLLDTAFHDLGRSLAAAGFCPDGAYPVRFGVDAALGPEAYQITTTREECRVLGGDVEGVRRGIYAFEEQLRRADGPFLPVGEWARTPVVRLRLSRCFFGPIKRPPRNRDELADGTDYYPEAYLSRLAREGVNGLWLTGSFHELAPSRFFPTFGADSARRLQKLRETAAKCARYGIGIYLFCIEPMGFKDGVHYSLPTEHLRRHPELAGHRDSGATFFCTSTETGQAYLEEATRHIFTQVPELAGLIGIHLGERPTHCYSNLFWDTQPNQCPRCSGKPPGVVFRGLLEALLRGMRQGNPRAQLISWLYVPTVFEQPGTPARELLRAAEEIAAHYPPGVIFQYNFESMGLTPQLGRERLVHDYSLAYTGPSEIFARCAHAAGRAGARTSAKLQVGCSHEVATLPWVPVPGQLFHKYRAMHELGVSAAMQSWYFGNYPSLMTRAAGRLSFAPLPVDEATFLHELAAPDWGEEAPLIAQAWRIFGEAYRRFPANVNFSWYGPVHDSVAWPLHLKPVGRAIAPSWRGGFAPSGDRIGESIGEAHRLDEVLTLCGEMAARWEEGVRLLRRIGPRRRAVPRLARELGVAEAMGIQLSSAAQVVRFYALRGELLSLAPGERAARLAQWEELRALVEREIALSERLCRLAQEDSRLGFHSEAEQHKYHPALLQWRVARLRDLLETEFPQARAAILHDLPLFAAEPTPQPASYQCATEVAHAPWALCEPGVPGWQTRWKAASAGGVLRFLVECRYPEGTRLAQADILSTDHVTLRIEPRPLWPVREFTIGHAGGRYDCVGTHPGEAPWRSRVCHGPGGWELELEIPLSLVAPQAGTLKINLIRKTPEGGTFAWVPLHPWPPRLLLGDTNPADLGLLHLPHLT